MCYFLYGAINNGINVVIGENNTGKSALIDAIRIALFDKII